MDSEPSTGFLGREVEVVIDRPLGSRHPRYGYLYPVNYGYVPGTVAGDGEALDACVLGVAGPLECFRGVCVAVIARRDDADDKLIVVPPQTVISDGAIRELTSFQEQHFHSRILRGH